MGIRTGEDECPPFVVGDWTVWPELDEIRQHGRVVKLEPRTMRLLVVLAERPGAVRSTEELLDRVWPGVIVSQGSVYQAVALLRRMLGDTGDEPRYVATVPRRGYRLVAAVGPLPIEEPLPARTLATAGAAEPQADEAARASRPWWRRVSFTAALALIAVVAVASLLAVRRAGDERAVQHAPPAIAVLPFANLTADEAQAPFTDGLTDELLNSLARLPGVRVIGRTSSFRFRERSSDVRAIGAELGVTHVLEGSVRRAGTRLRVSAQLVDARSGFQVWANTFERPVGAAIPVQMDISRAVVNALQVQLSPAADARLARGPTAVVNAYDLYLLGRHQQLKRDAAALERAIAHHRAALAADPSFALAHAGLADAYMAGYYYGGRSLDDTAKLVQPEVDAALRLDPELAEAYAAWAVLLTEQWRMDEAIEKLRRAIAINPNYAEAYVRLGAAYEYAGRPRDAIAAFDEAASLDPLHAVLHVRRCLVLQNVGRYPEAARACDRAFELQPEIPNSLWARGLLGFAQGDLAAAIRDHREALRRAPDRADIRGELLLLWLDAGLAERARDEAQTLAQQGRTTQSLLGLAAARLAAGDGAAVRRLLADARLMAAAPRERADAALYALAAEGRPLAARLLADMLAPATPGEDAIEPGIYRTRWGTSELRTLALLEAGRGRPEIAATHEQRLLDYLEELERAGQRWHAVHYLRAAVHARRGAHDEALRALARAVDAGWRRAWLTRSDPAFATLRDDARFAALLARMDAASAAARERLATDAPAPAPAPARTADAR